MNADGRLLTLDEWADLPITEDDATAEKAEFLAAQARAEAKGNRALDLLNACIPNPAEVMAWANDYGRTRQ